MILFKIRKFYLFFKKLKILVYNRNYEKFYLALIFVFLLSCSEKEAVQVDETPQMEDLDLEDMGVEIEDLPLEDMGLKIEDLSLEDMGIEIEDLNLEDMGLEIEVLPLEDMGIGIEDLDLESIVLQSGSVDEIRKSLDEYLPYTFNENDYSKLTKFALNGALVLVVAAIPVSGVALPVMFLANTAVNFAFDEISDTINSGGKIPNFKESMKNLGDSVVWGAVDTAMPFAGKTLKSGAKTLLKLKVVEKTLKGVKEGKTFKKLVKIVDKTKKPLTQKIESVAKPLTQKVKSVLKARGLKSFNIDKLKYSIEKGDRLYRTTKKGEKIFMGYLSEDGRIIRKIKGRKRLVGKINLGTSRIYLDKELKAMQDIGIRFDESGKIMNKMEGNFYLDRSGKKIAKIDKDGYLRKYDENFKACKKRGNGVYTCSAIAKIKDGRFDFEAKKLSELRSEGVSNAWKEERELIKKCGFGTVKWTKEEIVTILAKGRIPGYEGHHINSVAAHPSMAANPNNISFVSKEKHLEAHGGNFAKRSTGELIKREKILENCKIN